jgi:hypothetical protein
MPNRPPSWIASPLTRASTHLAPASAAHCVVGHHAKKTCGRAAAAIRGTRSIREGFAPRVSTTGLRPNACRAPDGRRIPIGMRTDEPLNGGDGGTIPTHKLWIAASPDFHIGQDFRYWAVLNYFA